MENLEKRCRGTHLQGRNVDAEVENKLLDVEGEEGRPWGESGGWD